MDPTGPHLQRRTLATLDWCVSVPFSQMSGALCPESQLGLCAIPLQKEKSCLSWGFGSSLPPSQLRHNQGHKEELLSDARSSMCTQSGSFQLSHCSCSSRLRVKMRGISKLLGESMWFADSTINPSRASGMPTPLPTPHIYNLQQNRTSFYGPASS